MNVYEIATKYRISLKKIRQMDKDGILRTSGDMGAADPIRATLAKGNPLPALQLVELVENPAILVELGQYLDSAERQLDAIGNPQHSAAPRDVAAVVEPAALGDGEAIAALIAWLQTIIPANRAVGHSYIATRLILGMPENLRKSLAKRINRSLLNCRKVSAFAGYWQTVEGVTQNRTVYQKKALDL